mmetsp:Transcript_10144/g.15474  ORF Transcript_10144/g.15474 Transcript_10144/m.15474 type:complete len:183 (-) Transcript_10144:20-568(-)
MVPQILGAIDFEARDCCYLGIVYFGAGILGGFLSSYTITKYPGPGLKVWAITFATATLCSYGSFQGVLFYFIEFDRDDPSSKEKAYRLSFVTMALIGFFNWGYLQACYSLSMQLTPRIGEAASSGLINMVSNLFALLVILYMAYLLSDRHKFASEDQVKYVLFIFYGCHLLAILLLCCVRRH